MAHQFHPLSSHDRGPFPTPGRATPSRPQHWPPARSTRPSAPDDRQRVRCALAQAQSLRGAPWAFLRGCRSGLSRMASRQSAFFAQDCCSQRSIQSPNPDHHHPRPRPARWHLQPPGTADMPPVAHGASKHLDGASIAPHALSGRHGARPAFEPDVTTAVVFPMRAHSVILPVIHRIVHRNRIIAPPTSA